MARSRSPYDALGVRTLRQGTMHRILTHQTHDETHRRNQKIINDPEYDFRIDRSENVADLHPSANLFQALRSHRTQNNEQAPENHPLPARQFTPEHNRPQTDYRKDASDRDIAGDFQKIAGNHSL